MARAGYNSQWLWKTWGSECRAATEAMKAGKYEEADEHLKLAELAGTQLALWENEEETDFTNG